jgi:hypothetical protein
MPKTTTPKGGVLDHRTVSRLAKFAVHKGSCGKVENSPVHGRIFDAHYECTCGLADLLSRLGLPDKGEKNVFNNPW